MEKGKYPMLDKLRELDEKNLLPDDDHLDRPNPMTEAETDQALDELIEKYKNRATKKKKK